MEAGAGSLVMTIEASLISSPLTSLPDPLLLSHVLCRLDARSLARLNQTATSFSERRPESEGWGGRSIVDEAARLVYERRDDHAQCPPVPATVMGKATPACNSMGTGS